MVTLPPFFSVSTAEEEAVVLSAARPVTALSVFSATETMSLFELVQITVGFAIFLSFSDVIVAVSILFFSSVSANGKERLFLSSVIPFTWLIRYFFF